MVKVTIIIRQLDTQKNKNVKDIINTFPNFEGSAHVPTFGSGLYLAVLL